MTDLRSLPFNPEFREGARNAIHTCLRVEKEEKVTVIADRACQEIAASIVAELVAVRRRGVSPRFWLPAP